MCFSLKIFLFQIKETLRSNIKKIDDDLVKLEKNIRTKKEEKANLNSSQYKTGENKKELAKIENLKQSTLQKLSEIKF